jgi:uncharacterized membrane protein YfcA
MLTPLSALLGFLGAFAAFHVGSWWIGAQRASADPDAPAEAKRGGGPSAREIGIGFLTDFLDTLGIGSFAPTTSIYKFFQIVPDQLIPGTLNVGHTLPSIAEAFIFTAVIDVDPITLILMIAAASAGAWLGASAVAGWPKKKVQFGLGFALLAAAALFIHRQLTGDPANAGALELTGLKLAIGLAGNFLLGALMTLGIGLYAPCMILVGLLGMNPKAAFPIMMGSCAFLMPVGSARFLRKNAYAFRPALGLTLGGLPGVFAAAYLVKELPLGGIRWLVIAVVLIAALLMLRSAVRDD